MILKAVEHIAALRGGSQAQIMRTNNGAYFAMKFLRSGTEFSSARRKKG